MMFEVLVKIDDVDEDEIDEVMEELEEQIDLIDVGRKVSVVSMRTYEGRV